MSEERQRVKAAFMPTTGVTKLILTAKDVERLEADGELDVYIEVFCRQIELTITVEDEG